MTSDTQARINLTALQRKDPYIVNILDSATHVAVYMYNPTSGEWEKTDIEGTLFVYSRLAPPVAGFTIMNQLSMNNFTEPLDAELEFQNQSPFLLYKNARMLIYGIWFYDMYDCSRIGNLLVKLSSNKSDFSKIPASQPAAPSSPNSSGSSSGLSMFDANVDEDTTLTSAALEESVMTNSVPNNSKSSVNIMDILTKARQDYDKARHKQSKVNPSAQNKITKSELFKPVPNEVESKKVSVGALFEHSNIKKNGQVNRPSSATTIDVAKPEKTSSIKQHSEESHRRYGSRSFSLSSTNEQIRNQMPSVVNGVISVEELESPVLGMPANRTRCYSVSEAGIQTVRSSNDVDTPFNKLLSKTSNLSVKDKNAGDTSKQVPAVTHPSNAASLAALSSIPMNYNQEKYFHRSLSIPVQLGNDNRLQTSSKTTNLSNISPSSYATSSTGSSLASLISSASPHTMPTLHEHFSSRGSAVVKSKSVASKLSSLSSETAVLNTQILSKYKNSSSSKSDFSRLLSPSVLQPSKAASQAIITAPSIHGNVSTASASSQSSAVINETALPTDQKTLISPEDFEHSSATPQKAMQLRKRLMPSQQDGIIKPLDQQQLANAIIKLLQTDKSFVDTIHEAYLSGISSTPNPIDSTTASLRIWK